jgi:hypothetical protein
VTVDLPSGGIVLPGSASDASPNGIGGTAEGQGAYIRNPVADRAVLTPFEALDAISRLSAILVVDLKYRETVDNPRVFNG